MPSCKGVHFRLEFYLVEVAFFSISNSLFPELINSAKCLPMKLPDWLDKTGTSQTALAKAIGVSQGRVSQLITGGSPSLDLALKIAGFTNNAVRPEDFCGPAMDTATSSVPSAE